MGRRVIIWAAVLLGSAWSLVPGRAEARDRYYALVFGSRSQPKRLRCTHTWATFVRVSGDVESRVRVEQNTISWLPETLDVKTWLISPEKGVNLDLHPTFDAVLKNGEGVILRGPFEVRAEVYEQSLWVRSILDSGAAVDSVFGRGHYPLIRVG